MTEPASVPDIRSQSALPGPGRLETRCLSSRQPWPCFSPPQGKPPSQPDSQRHEDMPLPPRQGPLLPHLAGGRCGQVCRAGFCQTGQHGEDLTKEGGPLWQVEGGNTRRAEPGWAAAPPSGSTPDLQLALGLTVRSSAPTPCPEGLPPSPFPPSLVSRSHRHT